MYIDNKSGWFGPTAQFELQTYKTDGEPARALAKCVIELDSDDLFDFDDSKVQRCRGERVLQDEVQSQGQVQRGARVWKG